MGDFVAIAAALSQNDVRSSTQGQQQAKQHCDTFCGKAACCSDAEHAALLQELLPCRKTCRNAAFCYSGNRALYIWIYLQK